jgi:hypothetical protein
MTPRPINRLEAQSAGEKVGVHPHTALVAIDSIQAQAGKN